MTSVSTTENSHSRHTLRYAHCGFGIPDVLEVAHIDGQRANNDIGNLVILCPNCHKILDLDLISNE
ncbi:MAG TPA: hypothetical protein DCM07_04180 [Planctomycetaceae bacterium]|uniref:HNH endonuclease n=1 Tax=Gimesia sp. TaxID=2024833 RepID=UPI000E8C630B|nr:hypothetical protein [Planctomycetaceae bacterium]HBL48255.1 hypothetical protein [Planctomycetaceae bacterium]